MDKKFFFNTFGYFEFNINEKDIRLDFEKEICNKFNLPLNTESIETPISGILGKYNNIRFKDFENDLLYETFYNNNI